MLVVRVKLANNLSVQLAASKKVLLFILGWVSLQLCPEPILLLVLIIHLP